MISRFHHLLLAAADPELAGKLADALIGGLIPIFAALYCLAIATGILQIRPKDPQKSAEIRTKYQTLFYIGAAILFFGGLFRMATPFIRPS